MIYDKNQYSFNIIITCMLLILMSSMVYIAYSINGLRSGIIQVNSSVSGINDRQNFNYIQAPHQRMDYLLTSEGFFVRSVNDFGNFSGPSMQPAIFDGNVVLQKRYVDAVELRQGQVIRYLNSDGMPIIHRIRAVYPDQVFVQGDNMDEGEFVQKSQITHVVLGVLFT